MRKNIKWIPEPKIPPLIPPEFYIALIIASLYGMIIHESLNDFTQTKKIIKIIIDELQQLGIIDDVEPEKIIKLLGL